MQFDFHFSTPLNINKTDPIKRIVDITYPTLSNKKAYNEALIHVYVISLI